MFTSLAQGISVRSSRRRCSVFLEILQNPQENTYVRNSFSIKLGLQQVFFCEFCEISKKPFYRTPPEDYF